MAAVVQLPKTLHQGVNYLSNNVQSSQIHTPLYLDRITTNQDAYNRFLQDYDAYQTKPKWGGARQESSLVANQSMVRRTKSEPSLKKPEFSHLDKNHLHFGGGGGFSYGRTFPDNARYDLTSLRRSNVRSTDELVPNSNKIDVRVAQINQTFPAERPLSSHASKLAVFPKFDHSSDMTNGTKEILEKSNCSHDSSAKPNVTVINKISGFPYRRELIGNAVPERNSSGVNSDKQNFSSGNLKNPCNGFPCAPPSIAWGKPPCLSVSQQTANALANLQTLYNKSEYTYQYKGNRQPSMTNSGYRLTNEVCGRNEQTSWEGSYGNRVADDKEAIFDHEKSRPYTSIYKADYTRSCHLSNYHGTPKPAVTNILARNKLKNTSSGNKSVTFNNKIVISDGYQTLSGVVNDLNAENTISTCRPVTAPAPQNVLARQDFINTNASGLTNTSPQPKLIRPYSTGSRPRPSNQLLEIQNNYSKTAARRKFHNDFPEKAPDIRRKPDLRITTNERRHIIPEVGCHSYYFHG